jgi:hypothetical protein
MRPSTLHSSMILALRAVRDGGHPTRAERFWLMDGGYIDDNDSLTMKGHNELNNDDNRKEDKPK